MKTITCERFAQLLNAGGDLSAFTEEEIVIADQHLETCECAAPTRELLRRAGHFLAKQQAGEQAKTAPIDVEAAPDASYEQSFLDFERSLFARLGR